MCTYILHIPHIIPNIPQVKLHIRSKFYENHIQRPEYEGKPQISNQQMSFLLFIPMLRSIFPPIFSNYEYKNTKRFTLWRRQYRISEAWWQTSVATYKPKYPSHIQNNQKWKVNFILFIFLLVEKEQHNRHIWTYIKRYRFFC